MGPREAKEYTRGKLDLWRSPKRRWRRFSTSGGGRKSGGSATRRPPVKKSEGKSEMGLLEFTSAGKKMGAHWFARRGRGSAGGAFRQSGRRRPRRCYAVARVWSRGSEELERGRRDGKMGSGARLYGPRRGCTVRRVHGRVRAGQLASGSALTARAPCSGGEELLREGEGVNAAVGTHGARRSGRVSGAATGARVAGACAHEACCSSAVEEGGDREKCSARWERERDSRGVREVSGAVLSRGRRKGWRGRGGKRKGRALASGSPGPLAVRGRFHGGERIGCIDPK